MDKFLDKKQDYNNGSLSIELLNFLKSEIKTAIESSEKTTNTKIENE